jgi:hypothetical protein
MEDELFEVVCSDIEGRKSWAQKQPVWYAIRRDGLRRKNKPWPNAADLHYPLVDTVTDKLKPFYVNQLFATERVADFVSAEPQDNEDVLAASWWFDYKHESNLEDAIYLAIDSMLVYGRSIVKGYWHSDSKSICYDPIEPLYIIVPEGTQDIRFAERVVHVQHLTPWEYKHGPMSKHYRQDKDFIKMITGGKDYDDEASFQGHRRTAEGITHSESQECIIIWEIYERQPDLKYKVHTISPARPREEIRSSFILPHKRYLTDQPPITPFVDFTIEKVGKSWYSPRGVAEILIAHETSLTKMWNSKHDAMSIYNQPMLTSTKDVPITQNVRCYPGQIIPFAVQALQIGAPPISYDEEMSNTRSVAEQRISVPDFGIGDKGFESASPIKEAKTATEVQAITAVGNQIIDMRARIFRRALAKLYALSWDVLYQYDEAMSYLHEDEFRDLPEGAKEKVRAIRPNGSSQTWNIGARLKKAIQRKALLGQSPYINQAELDKTILELDEPGLVARLWVDPKEEELRDAEGQMKEIPTLMQGLPLSAHLEDNHPAHLGVLQQFILNQMKTNAPPNQQGEAMIMQHYQQHLKILESINPKQARQFDKALKQQIAQLRMLQQAQQGGNGQRGQLPAGPPAPQPAMMG